MLLFLSLLVGKDLSVYREGFSFKLFKMLKMLRDFRDELFQPFIVQLEESLRWIPRILTWDSPNPYGGFSEWLPLVVQICV